MKAKKLLEQTFGQKQLAVLSDPFPNQVQQTIVDMTQAPLQRGNQTTPQQGSSSSTVPHVYTVTFKDVNIQIREKNYEAKDKRTKK